MLEPLPVIGIALTLLLLLFVIGARRGLEVTLAHYKRSLAQFNGDPDVATTSLRIYIIVPALREQPVIERLLAKLITMGGRTFSVAVLVALREDEIPDKTGQTTLEVATAFIERHQETPVRVETVLYAGTGQGRACQLNAALERIGLEVQSKGLNDRNVVIGVYDADSYPHQDSIRYVAWRIQKNQDVMALQQYLDYRANLEALKSASSAWILLGNASYQTAWNYFFEIPRFLSTNRQLMQGAFVSFPPYCMGHGEFVRFDVLKKLGGFSTTGTADGIQLGFELSLNKIPVEPIPLHDLCESPTSLLALFHQHARWFAGNLTAFRHIAKAHQPVLVSLRQTVGHIILNLKWLFRPCLVLAVIVTSVLATLAHPFMAPSLAAGVGAIAYYGVLIKRAISEIGDPRIRDDPHGMDSSAALCAAGLKSLGPWLWILQQTRRLVTGTEPSLRKVERTHPGRSSLFSRE